MTQIKSFIFEQLVKKPYYEILTKTTVQSSKQYKLALVGEHNYCTLKLEVLETQLEEAINFLRAEDQEKMHEFFSSEFDYAVREKDEKFFKELMIKKFSGQE